MIHFLRENISENIDENLKNWIENINISEGEKIRRNQLYFSVMMNLLKINQDFSATH